MTVGHPFVVNVVELRRVVGNQREIGLHEPVPEVALPSCRVELGSPLDVDLLLETVSGGISATGRITGRWNGECRRCLEPVVGDLDVEVAETFEERFTEGETYPIDGDTIDLEPMIRELAILGLPINPVCRDDCAGPVPDQLPVTVTVPLAVPPSGSGQPAPSVTLTAPIVHG